jgi:hypothetical protein
MSTVDPGSVLRMLLAANVQFVVVGDPEAEGALRMVVSTHPTNLDALGRALERLSATVRLDDGVEAQAGPTSGPQRVGDALGTVDVATSAGDLVLLLGGAHQSLYAETAGTSVEREIAGVTVRWAAEPAALERAQRPTGRALGGRLLSLAGRLAHLVERRGERDEMDSGGPDTRSQGGGDRNGDAGPAPEDAGSPGADRTNS